jgi:hypothetical protein
MDRGGFYGEKVQSYTTEFRVEAVKLVFGFTTEKAPEWSEPGRPTNAP